MSVTASLTYGSRRPTTFSTPGAQSSWRSWNATPSEHLTLLATKTGKPYAPNDLSDEFRGWRDEARLPSNCSIHELRKAAARRLAEAGCSAHEIAAITGHRTLKEVERYTRSAEQARLARQAMARQENKA